MNKVILFGRLTKEPELKTGTTSDFCKLSIAVNNYKDSADFFNCTAFGKTAQTIARFVNKGDQLCISGRLQTGSYEKNGQKIYTTDVIIENASFVSANRKSEQLPDEDDLDELPF